MNTNQKYLFPLIFVAIAAVTVSCSSNSTSRNNITSAPATQSSSTPFSTPSPEPTPTLSPSPSPTANPTPSPSMAQLRAKSKLSTQSTPKLTPDASKALGKITNVTVYTSDPQCQEFVGKEVKVSAGEPVANAVGKVIEERDTADFSLSGYRVNVKDGVATVDLRISPESKRQFTSLSSCEQFALFGSLRKTLTSNAQWNIKEVRFTEKGEEIPI
jgi:hypothetical protein